MSTSVNNFEYGFEFRSRNMHYAAPGGTAHNRRTGMRMLKQIEKGENILFLASTQLVQKSEIRGMPF
jgi:hypothetical protein